MVGDGFPGGIARRINSQWLADLVLPAAALTMNVLIRRRWINLGLLGLAVGLAALTWFEPGMKPPEAVLPLLDRPPTRIERIEVLRPDRELLVFEQQEGRWRMTAPDSGWANPVLLNRVLEIATVHCPLQYSAAELDLPMLRLEPPQLRLRLDDREIRFGSTTPTDGLRYLQIGAIVHLCPDRWYPLLTSAAASFLAPAMESSPPPATQAK
jgi:hypothetical protein